MAQKLNKKLVFVVGSLLIVLVVGGAAMLLIRYKYDAERHIRAGDQAASAGDYSKAAEAYGRAVQKKRTSTAYLEKFLDATLKIRSTTENDARERYTQYLQALASIARADRGNVDRWRSYLDALLQQAEAIGSVSIWKSVSDTCNEMALACPQGSPGQAVAKVYSGFASLRRVDSLDDAERSDMVTKLKDAAADPGLNARERDMAYGTLARLAVLDLARARTTGIAVRIDATAKACDASIADATKNSPNGVQVALALFERALIDAKGNTAGPALLERIDALRAAAEASDLDGMQALAVAGALARGGKDGVEAAAALLGGYTAKHPDALMQRRARAFLVRPVDREAALKEIEAALALERPATGIVAASFEGNRLSCALIRFDILHDAIDRSKDADRDEAIKRATAARDEVEKLLKGTADQSALLRADAKLAMSRAEYQQAAVKLNEVFKKGSAVDLELYILSAMCSQQLGETGRALDLVSSGLQLTPTNTQLLKLRAQLELRTGKPQVALATMRQVRSLDPADKEAEEYEARLVNMLATDPGSTAGLAANMATADAFGRVQEAMDARNFDRARELVATMRKAAKEPDVRLERLAIVVEMQSGETAKAQEMAKAAMAKFPGDGALVRLGAVLSSEDPVERVIAMAEGSTLDEKERAVLIYLRMLQSEAGVRAAAEREKRLGSANAAVTAKAAARLAEGLTEWRKKAEAADRMHPVLLESDFRAAMDKKDYAAAAAVVKLAKEGGRDASQVPLLESQLLVDQGKSREAIEVLERAIQNGLDTSNVYRTLGSVIERQGNLEGAVRQYEEAYKRKPEDMQTVRLLVGACVRAGNLQRGLDVLRTARQVAGLDEEIGNVWLSLESQIGDRRLALALRENQYRATPADEQNAIALATTLMVSTPERTDILTEGGEPAYSEAAWQGLTEGGRNAAVDRTRAGWRKRAEDIFTDAMRRRPGSIEASEPYANLLRSLGRDNDAIKVLADAVAAGGTEAGWRGPLALGNIQLQLGRRDDASATFAEAVRREDKKTRDATRALIELLVAQDRYAMALPYLEDLAKSDPEPTVKFRLAEALMRVDRLDDARAVFMSAVAGNSERSYGQEILDGTLSVAAGDKLRTAGKNAEAKTAYESALGPFQRAKSLAPAAAQPFMQDAILKRKLFEVTADRNRLQEALASADKAVSLSAAFFPACAVRSEVLLSGGDIAGALNEYERLLKLLPSSVDARRRLVELSLAAGDLGRAETALRTAIGISPGEAAWHFALGDVLSRRNRFAEAAVAFNRADTLRPDAPSFLREIDSRIRAKDYRGVTEAARRRGDFVRSNSTARAYTGVALIAAGEPGDGVKTLTEAYQDAMKTAAADDERMVSEWFTALDLIYGPNEIAQAEDLLKKVMPNALTPRAGVYLATLSLRAGTGGPQKAIAFLQPFEAADYSKSPVTGAAVLDRLGTAYYMAGECAKAIASFEKAIALTPDSDGVLNNFAYLCGECLKDPKRGLPAARRAVQLNPGRVEYLDTLGSLLVADSQFREAIELLDRAAGISSTAAVQYHRAQALVGLNKKEDARAACAMALKLNPDPPTKKAVEEIQQKLN